LPELLRALEIWEENANKHERAADIALGHALGAKRVSCAWTTPERTVNFASGAYLEGDYPLEHGAGKSTAPIRLGFCDLRKATAVRLVPSPSVIPRGRPSVAAIARDRENIRRRWAGGSSKSAILQQVARGVASALIFAPWAAGDTPQPQIPSIFKPESTPAIPGSDCFEVARLV